MRVKPKKKPQPEVKVGKFIVTMGWYGYILKFNAVIPFEKKSQKVPAQPPKQAGPSNYQICKTIETLPRQQW